MKTHRSAWAVAAWLVLVHAALAAEPQFAGRWQTTFGTMSLSQQGSDVQGIYVSQDDVGTLEGQIKENKLQFKYQEPDARGEGWFELAADGKSFSGQWREEGDAAWAGWEGQRVQSAPSPPAEASFDGVWLGTYGRMRLVQHGKQVQGSYAYADGSSISGTVKGRRLSFQYTEPNAAGEGYFELSDDRSAIHGKWRASGETEWSAWSALRVEPTPGLVWLVVIEAPWEQSLDRPEYSFGEMLKSFFARSPNVQVRQRFFNDEAGFRKWCREVSYLAEPAVVAIASHGSPQGLSAGGTTIGPEAIADALRNAGNVRLLHFSACLTMQGDLAERTLKNLKGGARFPISGYRTSVDWAASAVLEFMYFELVLTRGMEPAKAVEQLRILMPFSGPDDLPGAELKSAGLRIALPGAPPAAEPPQKPAAADVPPPPAPERK